MYVRLGFYVLHLLGKMAGKVHVCHDVHRGWCTVGYRFYTYDTRSQGAIKLSKEVWYVIIILDPIVVFVLYIDS